MHRLSPRRVAASIFVLLAAGLLGLKLFTTEVSFADESSVGLAVRFQPGFGNSVQIRSGENPSGIYFLVLDENEYIGGRLYRFLVDGGWLAGCLGSLVLAVWCMRRSISDRSRSWRT